MYRVGLNWSRSFLRRAMRPAPIWVTNPQAWSTSAPIDPAVDRLNTQLADVGPTGITVVASV